jgi:uncharacterized protein YjbI with pentapeptide repeats
LRGARLNFSYLKKTQFFGADLQNAQLCSVHGVDSETDFSAVNLATVWTITNEVRKFFPEANAGTLKIDSLRHSMIAQYDSDKFRLGSKCDGCTELSASERNEAVARWSFSVNQKLLVPESFEGDKMGTTQARYAMCDLGF